MGADEPRPSGDYGSHAPYRTAPVFVTFEGLDGSGKTTQAELLAESLRTDGREVVLNVYGPGEFFGEFALLDGEPRSADAIAQDDCLLYWLTREDFLAKLVPQGGMSRAKGSAGLVGLFVKPAN